MDNFTIMIRAPIEQYNWLMDRGDPRLKNWPLVESPSPTIVLCLLYVYFVKILGPELMANRKPLDLRYLMMVYNFFMIILNSYIFISGGVYGWFGKYNLLCQPMDYSMSRDGYGMAQITWVYYISKFVDFFDSIFFILRKKFSQVTNLHVIHHGLMPLVVWSAVKFCPGGHGTFPGFSNSFVHIIMYTYYGLAACGPKIQKYLWSKKYITAFQMIQFVAIFIHGNLLLVYDCGFPKFYAYELMVIAVLFFSLFFNYFTKTYRKSKQQ
ncbi:very long chain fatty acid elongase AAEL008004-like [Brevipalpus obovatus]|uniref:very long chain fatty acid elongase AAEL008004-like n=1 Tax=Brevipalpus obovatus TaxID=246614 RepID=UPI003D9DCAD0